MIGSPARLPVAYAVLAECDWRRSTHLIRATGPTEPPKPRLLDRVRGAIRARHMSRSTEESYVEDGTANTRTRTNRVPLR